MEQLSLFEVEKVEYVTQQKQLYKSEKELESEEKAIKELAIECMKEISIKREINIVFVELTTEIRDSNRIYKVNFTHDLDVDDDIEAQKQLSNENDFYFKVHNLVKGFVIFAGDEITKNTICPYACVNDFYYDRTTETVVKSK